MASWVCLAAGLSLLAVVATVAAAQGRDVRAWVDHVVVGVGDLETGIAAFEELSGVRAAFGGEHPAIGTHNALVSLGEGTYLEIIAPRPDAEVQGGWAGLEGLTELTPVGWAVGTDDLDAALEALRAAGLQTTEPTPGSRVTPGGATLRWSAAGLAEPGVGTVPFLIEWAAASPHPSSTSPSGCRLGRLEIVDPEPGPVTRLTTALGLDAEVATGEAPGLRVTLECPAGTVVLPR